MTSWNEGYITDTEYTAGFYRDLTPALLRACLLLQGFDLPHRAEGEPLRYLELGYGQGLSLNLHAAAVNADIWGTDFNPNHTLFAEELRTRAGLQAHVLNQSFAELAARDDLPQFDIIALHGVWSWISDENRQHILHLVAHNLKMGGACFLSYNALPGWASIMPLRDLMFMHGTMHGVEGEETLKRVGESYSFVEAMNKSGAAYFSANPLAQNNLKSMATQPVSYLAHEYFNQASYPFYFADVAKALQGAKCSYANSTRLLQTMDSLCFPPEAQPLLQQSATSTWHETLRDYYLNQRFRADIFIKGDKGLSPQEQGSRLGSLPLALTQIREKISMSVNGPRGQVQLREDIYLPLLDSMAADSYRPKSLEELEALPALQGLSRPVLVEALTVLLGAGIAHPVQNAADCAAMAEACQRFNAILLEQTWNGANHMVLASPVLGGGLPVEPLEQMFLYSLKNNGESAPEGWAATMVQRLADQGQSILREGKALSAEDAQKELQSLADTFLSQRLPLLRALQVSR